MSRTPEQVLADHPRYPYDSASGWFVCRGCRVEVETSLSHVDDEFRAHQAQALRDAGLLAAPRPTCGCLACNPKAMWMSVCEHCGDKRCPHAADHKSDCLDWIGRRL